MSVLLICTEEADAIVGGCDLPNSISVFGIIAALFIVQMNFPLPLEKM